MTPSADRDSALATIEAERVSAIIRSDKQSLAAAAMSAAVDGGFKIVEFTLTTPGAYELINSFAERDGLLVGAGTVLSGDQVREAVDAGARFLVSPIVDPEIIRVANDLGVAIIPGAYTPTEMETAHRAGADLVKVFPATAGGVDFIRAVRGPLPHLRLFPTAGVTPDNFLHYLDAGCAGVGFVRSLFEPVDLSDENFEAIRRRAASIISNLATWHAAR